MTRSREAAKRLLPRLNRLTERLGFTVAPVHYYADSPSRRWLDSHRSQWAKASSLPGVDWDTAAQLQWLRAMAGPYLAETSGLDRYHALMESHVGPGYGPIESQVLHCVLRRTAPRRLIEIGSGVSTLVALDAISENEAEGRSTTTITCVEPLPSAALRAERRIQLIAAPAQEVRTDLFQQLEAGDLLFIDSTHAVRTGSEVLRIYLEIIPALPSGVLIHVHDIYLPYLFNPWVLEFPFDWQETALLTALLIDNPRIAISCSLSGLHHERSAQLRELFPDYEPAAMVDGVATAAQGAGHFPASTWLETC